MSGDLRDALADHGISLRRYEPGKHRAPCPWCDKGPRDDALAVKVNQDGATWLCHRCQAKGAAGGQVQAGCRRTESPSDTIPCRIGAAPYGRNPARSRAIASPADT